MNQAYPQAYLEVLRQAQKLGADLGDRITLLENEAGSVNLSSPTQHKPNQQSGVTK